MLSRCFLDFSVHGCRGFCHMTESYLFLFLLYIQILKDIFKYLNISFIHLKIPLIHLKIHSIHFKILREKGRDLTHLKISSNITYVFNSFEDIFNYPEISSDN